MLFFFVISSLPAYYCSQTWSNVLTFEPRSHKTPLGHSESTKACTSTVLPNTVIEETKKPRHAKYYCLQLESGRAATAITYSAVSPFGTICVTVCSRSHFRKWRYAGPASSATAQSSKYPPQDSFATRTRGHSRVRPCHYRRLPRYFRISMMLPTSPAKGDFLLLNSHVRARREVLYTDPCTLAANKVDEYLCPLLSQ
jgi:hypothetical protein